MVDYKKRKRKGIDLPVTFEGVLPPQDQDLEMAILGTILVDRNVLDEAIQDFIPDLFFKHAHRIIAETIIQLYEHNDPIDILTVSTQLKRNGKLEDAGGPGYIARLTNKIASTYNFDTHLRLLQQECLKRSMIQICSEAVKNAYNEQEDVFDIFQGTLTNLDDAMKNIIHYSAKTVGQVHDDIIKKSIEIAAKGLKSGVPCGLRMMDNVTNGWQKSDLIILAGRPGMGKSAAAVCMAMHPAVEKNIPVAIFSLEMSSEQLVSRMQSQLSGVDVSRVVKKMLHHDEIDAIAVTGEPLRNAPLYIDDTAGLSLLELKGKARKLVREHKVELIIIDYLQLMRSGLNLTNREQEIAEISRGLKTLAKELHIPVIALSQLSRAVELTADKKPMLSHLRESGQIEQDADMVIFCYRPEYYGIDTYEVGNETFDTNGLFMFLIEKHRNGSLGEVPAMFIKEQTKLVNHSYNNNTNSQDNRTFVQQHDSSTSEQSNALKENSDFNASEEVPF
jgi:replicative DNA helicase